MIPVLLSVSVPSFSASISRLSSQKVVMEEGCLVLQCVLGGCGAKDGVWEPVEVQPLEDCGCASGSRAGLDIQICWQ